LRTEPIFYVYFFYRGESTVPFYIGKGCFARIDGHEMCARTHANCKHLTCRIIRKEWREGRDIRKVKIADGIPEQAAFDLERLYISIAAIYGWPLVNKTTGGEGVSGYQHTEEQKAERKLLAQRLRDEGKFDHLRTVNIGREQPLEERKRRGEILAQAWTDPELLAQKSQQSKEMWERPGHREKQHEAMSTPEVHAKLAYWKGKESPKAKTYPGFVSPDGTIIEEVKNLTHFARQNGLQVSGMCLVAEGKQHAHLGWTRYPPLEKEPVYCGPGFVSPTGEIYTQIENISEFARRFDLPPNTMSEVNRGKRKSCKGWTKYNPDLDQPTLF
jgi:hypothetical protein